MAKKTKFNYFDYNNIVNRIKREQIKRQKALENYERQKQYKERLKTENQSKEI